jgi:hypothetical protein
MEDYEPREIFSIKIDCGGRSYFFDIKVNREGDRYLTIHETSRAAREKGERHMIKIFEDHAHSFNSAFARVLEEMQKPDRD